MKSMVFWEVFVNKTEKFFRYVCFDVFGIRRIVPYYVSFSVCSTVVGIRVINKFYILLITAAF